MPDDAATQALSSYRSTFVIASVVLILLDLAYTGIRIQMGRSTENFSNYAFSRVTVLFLMVVVWIVDQLVPTLPLLYLTSLFYSGVSVVHILRQAHEEGAEVPPSLVQRAEVLEASGDAPAEPAKPVSETATPGSDDDDMLADPTKRAPESPNTPHPAPPPASPPP